jgi:hypothetical protein
VAGAIRLNYPTTASTQSPAQAAQTAATQNGFQNGGNGGNVVVTVTSPYAGTPPYPSATAYPANTAVQVVVTQTTETQFFSGIFGTSNFGSNSARAVAVGGVADTSTCLTQIGTSGSLTSDGKPITTNCGIIAMGAIKATQGYSGTTSLGYWGPSNPSGPGDVSGISGPVSPLAAPATDPCSLIAGCAYLQTNIAPNVGAANWQATNSVSAPLGGYAVIDNCCAGGTVALGPGLYYFYGGISGTLRGTGVTVVNVNGSMTASGLGSVSSGQNYLSAPTSGSTAGVAFYQPLINTSPITLSGGGNGTNSWDGLFYAPGATLTVNGTGVTVANLVIGGITENGHYITVDALGGGPSVNQQAFPTHVVLSE